MAKKKDFSIGIDPEKVVYTTISKAKDGYNYARVLVKTDDKEFMSISYEWEGDHVPDFAMALMSFMQANQANAGVWPGKEAEYAEFQDDKEDPSDE